MTDEEALKQLQAEQEQYQFQSANYDLNTTKASGDTFNSLSQTSGPSFTPAVVGAPGVMNTYIGDDGVRRDTPAPPPQISREGTGRFAGYTFNASTGNFQAPPPPSSKTVTPVNKVELLAPTSTQTNTERLLGPTEFNRLREQFGADASTFDQFFRRDEQGNIYLRGGVTPTGVDLLNMGGGDRLLGPTEFNQLRKDLGVNESNFDQFFRRDDKGNIYLKTGELGNVSTGALSITEDQYNQPFSSDVFTVTDLEFPDTPEVDFNGFVNSLNRMFEITMSQQQKEYEQEQQRLYDMFQVKLQEVENQPERLKQLEEEYQVREKYDALSEMALQIQSTQAEFDQLVFDQGQQTINAGIIRGQQNAALQAKAVTLGAMQGTFQAMAGNFEIANQMLNRAIDVEFGALEQSINMTRDMIALNQDRLSKEESKQAFKIEQIMKLREEALAEQKAEKDAIKSMMLEVAQMGGDPRGIDFNKSLQENMVFYSKQMKVLNEQERQFRIQEAQALAGVQIVTDENGNPIKAINNLTGEEVMNYTNPEGGYIQSIAKGGYVGYGSSAWEYGLDVDLEVGDPVFSGVSGTVVDVVSDQTGATSGFGNQVKVLDDNGNEVWYSHLAGTSVQIGQRVSAGQLLGTGGNTGMVMDINGNPVSAAGRTEGVGSHLDITIQRPDGSYFDAYSVENYLNEQFKIANTPVPEEEVVEVDQEVLQQAQNQKSELESKISLINEIANSEGLAGSVGAYGIARWTPFKVDKAERADFMSKLLQLVDKESVSKLLEIKAAGGTFGQLSDKELQVLRSSATAINNWIERDENGNATGAVVVSEDLFMQELDKLRDSTLNTISELDAILGGTDSFLDSLGL